MAWINCKQAACLQISQSFLGFKTKLFFQKKWVLKFGLPSSTYVCCAGDSWRITWIKHGTDDFFFFWGERSQNRLNLERFSSLRIRRRRLEKIPFPPGSMLIRSARQSRTASADSMIFLCNLLVVVWRILIGVGTGHLTLSFCFLAPLNSVRLHQAADITCGQRDVRPVKVHATGLSFAVVLLD